MRRPGVIRPFCIHRASISRNIAPCEQATGRMSAAGRDPVVAAGPRHPLSEIELASRLGVSRTPLRAALARLALKGLVDTNRGRTGIVSDVSAESVAELFELREALETQAARLAARRRDPEVFARSPTSRGRGDPGRTGVDAYYQVVRGSMTRSTRRSEIRRSGAPSTGCARTSSAPGAWPPTTPPGCSAPRRSTA